MMASTRLMYARYLIQTLVSTANSTKVNIWLEDGSTYTFAQEGRMEQLQWSQASSVCQGEPFAPTDGVPLPGKRGLRFLA